MMVNTSNNHAKNKSICFFKRKIDMVHNDLMIQAELRFLVLELEMIIVGLFSKDDDGVKVVCTIRSIY